MMVLVTASALRIEEQTTAGLYGRPRMKLE